METIFIVLITFALSSFVITKFWVIVLKKMIKDVDIIVMKEKKWMK